MVSDALASRVSIAITVSASFAACASDSPASTKILAHMLHVLLALLHALCVCPRIVVALRQPQPARTIEADHLTSNPQSPDSIPFRRMHSRQCHANAPAARAASAADLKRGNALQLRLAAAQSPSLFTAAVSMQLAYSSPIFCSFAVRVAEATAACFQDLPQVQPVQLGQLRESPIRQPDPQAADCA